MLRFHLPYTSLNRGAALDGEEWHIELHDSAFSGTAAEVDGEYIGHNIEWEGENDPPGPVMASSLTYSMVIHDEAGMAIVTALAGAAMGRFKIVVRRAGSTEVYWAGWVYPEDTSYPDAYFPFHFSIFATDGIARLKDVDYMQDETTFFTGEESIIAHLVRIIEKIGTDDVGTWPTARIRSTANWWEVGMNTDTCPLDQTMVRHDRFVNNDREGNPKPWSYYAVLDALLRWANCQLLHEGGMYHVRQIDSYGDATQTAYYYDATGTYLDQAPEDMDLAVDYASADGMVKAAGGRYTWLQPLREVCTDYHHLTSANRATGQYWDRLDTAWATLPWVVLVDADETTYLKGSIKVRTRSQIGINPPGSAIYPSHRYVFKIQIRIITGGGDYYYLTRTTTATTAFYEIEADEMAWEVGGTDHFKIYSDTHTEADNLLEKLTQISFTSPFLYTAFDAQNIEMRVTLDHVEKTDGTTLTVPGGNYVGRIDDWNTTNIWLSVEEEGVGSNPDNETMRTCAEVTGDNTEKRCLDTYLGDGPAPFSLSALHLPDGTATSEWKIGSPGAGVPIAEILAKTVLKFRKTPQAVYQGEFIHPLITPITRFVDGDKAWMATKITLRGFENRWGGEFVVMDGDLDGISTSEPYIPHGPLPPHTPPNYPGPSPQGDPISDTGGFAGGDPPPFDGLHGGTVGGFVQMHEQSITKLRTDLLASDFNTTRLLPVNTMTHAFARKGDRLVVINPTNNHRETFYVGTSYVPSANTITMSGTDSPMVKDFPYGSIVKLYQPDLVRVKGWSYFVENQTGEYVTIPNPNTTDPATAGPGGLLPPSTVYDEATLRERIEVWRGNTRVFYRPSASDFGFALASSNRLRFWLPLSGEDVFVIVR